MEKNIFASLGLKSLKKSDLELDPDPHQKVADPLHWLNPPFTIFCRPYIEQTELGAELSCLVAALPPAHLAWYRGDTLLASQQYNTTTHFNMYRLNFHPEGDALGTYE
jgi:hypothetical protein